MSIDVTNNVNSRKYSEPTAVGPRRSPKPSTGSDSISAEQTDTEADVVGLSAEGRELVNASNSSPTGGVAHGTGSSNVVAIQGNDASADAEPSEADKARELAKATADLITANPGTSLYAQAGNLQPQILSLLFG